jgi:phosphotriesterase-related protein
MAAGQVRTVLGDVAPEAIGATLTHEHLLIEFSHWRRVAGVLSPEQDPSRLPPLSWESSGRARRYGNPVDYRLDDEETAIAELVRFRDAGGGCIVDATNWDLGRRAEPLARIARATSVHIVMGCGNYVGAHHPLDMDRLSEDEIVAAIVRDVTEGADGTEIRAGIIGEIGSEAPMTANECKALRAAARAQRLTGAPLLIHPGRDPSAPLETVRVVIEAGGDPERTIVGHIDRTLFELTQMVELAQTGCYLEFDLFGQESSYYSLAPIDMPNDAGRIEHLQGLIAEGFGERLLVAQDICRKTSLVRYGGDGYGHILENVVPVMRRKGMAEEQIQTILVGNPARILEFVEPLS